MNILLIIGLMLIIGYSLGIGFNKIGLPKIIGYILTGVAFSPNTVDFISGDIVELTDPLLDVCLAFIAFEVGGSLKWSKLKEHGREVISITLMGGIVPFLFVVAGIFVFGQIFSSAFSFEGIELLMFALLLGALASPTEPAATIGVMHEYEARGEVSDTILGVVALDDVLGIVLFSITISAISVFTSVHAHTGVFDIRLLSSVYQVLGAILIGGIIGFAIVLIGRNFNLEGEGQWVVIIFPLVIFCAGVAKLLKVDELLAYMVMGVVVVNKCKQHDLIFSILRRYTEELIFLFFFLLSGLHLDISAIPKALILILLFVLLRAFGKFSGAAAGGRMVNAGAAIRKYTASGLLPQGGIVIGLVLSIYEQEGFREFSDVLLATVMGAAIVNELIGAVITKHALIQSGDITI